MNPFFNCEYGTLVRDVITGYCGTVTGYAHYYDRRENSYLVEGIDSTGRPIESWIPENRIERVKQFDEC